MAAPHEFCAAIFPDPGPWFPVYRKGTRRIASLVQVESIGPDGSQAASLGNVEMIDSTNRFALSPLSRCSRGRALANRFPHLARVCFVSQPHMCLVREMNPPDLAALGHPPSTREGGALQRAFLFPHLCLAYVVQEYISLPPTAARSPPFKGGFSVSPLRGQSVLWQPGTLMGNGGMIDSSNRFCPLTAIAVFPRESTC